IKFIRLEKSKTSICLLHVRWLHVRVVTGRQLASNFVVGVEISRLRPPFKYNQALSLAPPATFDLTNPKGDTRWSKHFERYRIASGLNVKSDVEQINCFPPI